MNCYLISPECFKFSRYFYTFKNISSASWQQKVESCGVVTTRSKWWEEAKTKCVLKIINSLPLGPKSLNPTTWLVQAVKVFVECLWLIEWWVQSRIIYRALYWSSVTEPLFPGLREADAKRTAVVFNSPQVYSGCGWWDEMVLAVEAASCLTLPPLSRRQQGCNS